MNAKRFVTMFAGLAVVSSLFSCKKEEPKPNFADDPCEYSGKIQSYLDVYKDIWNAAAPSGYELEKVVGFDSPEYYKSKQVYVPELEMEWGTEIPSSGDIYFCGLNGEGTPEDERVIDIVFAQFFELDFSGATWAPNPYFAGKKVNCLACYATVKYAEYGDFSADAYKNAVIWIMEKDGRIAYFNSAGEKLHGLEGSYRMGRGDPYSRDNIHPLSLGLTGPGEPAVESIYSLGTEDDSGIIGLGYSIPSSVHIETSQITDGFRFSFSSDAWVSFQDEECETPLLHKPFSVDSTFEGSKFMEYYPEKTINIGRPSSLVEPYLKEYNLTKKQYGDSYYYDCDGKAIILSNKKMTSYDITNYSSYATCVFEEGKCLEAVVHFPDTISLKLIPFGKEWLPRLLTIRQSNDYIPLKIDNPIQFFSEPYLLAKYLSYHLWKYYK